jgi:hypothetical protein
MANEAVDFTHEFVSFSLARPAQFGLENFAGDPLVKLFYEWVLDSSALDVKIYVSWECPPDVSVIGLPTGGAALIRSERLDTMLVEFYRLQHIQSMFGGGLADDIVLGQVLRWMAEFLIGYRHSALAMDALQSRPVLEGVQPGIWNPFRDETLNSIPVETRVALQCFCLAHELGHLAEEVAGATSIHTKIDGISVVSHIDYELRNSGCDPAELENFRRYCESEINAPQLVAEIQADLFAFDRVCEFLYSALSCSPETCVALALASFQALIVLYHCKEICRLLAQVTTGDLGGEGHEELRFLNRMQWVARARAIGRRAGITLTHLEQGSVDDYQINVTRIDALIGETQAQRDRVSDMLQVCDESLLRSAIDRSRGDLVIPMLSERFELDPDLRLEVYYLLIAFGCSGAVNAVDYLIDMDRTVHNVR